MKIRNSLPLVTVFLFSLIVAFSCTNYQKISPPSTGSPTASKTETIQMGFSAWPGWFPWQVAAEQKLFDANKVNVDLKWFDDYTDSIKALIVAQLDANSQTLNDTISSVGAGSDQVIVLVNDNSTGNDKIIVRDGINSVADLKDKKVAADEGTVDHYLLLLGLKKAGLTQKDIDFQPLETGAAAAAFAVGQFDAVAVYAPFITKALERKGSKELFSSKDFPGAIPDILVVSRKLINERPQDIQALVDSWFDTLKFISANKEKAYEIMAKRAGVSVQEYKDYDQGTKIFTVEENLQAFTPSKDKTYLANDAQEISKLLIESGLLRQAPDLSKMFDDRFVKAYAAKAKNTKN